MAVTSMTIYANDGSGMPRLGLDRTVADALATWCDQTFDVQGRRKAVARHFDLTMDEARTVLEARASRTVIDRVLKHPNGGWKVALPVIGAVVGQTADAFILQEQERLADERRSFEAQEARLGQMARDLRIVVPLRLGESSRRAG